MVREKNKGKQAISAEVVKSEKVKKPLKVELIEGDNTPSFYANHVECRVSNEDVALTFALRKYSAPEDEAEVLCRNYLTIPHFVRLTGLMLRQLRQMVKLEILPEQVIKDVKNELGDSSNKDKNGKSK